ncbi:putative calcium-binding mitochondrial carrier protein Aralar1 isoform X2 [Apostichopus japonicus]|uniref:Putative calcium-binding mitochondrial carrier protein Aralar1 isoform X2 n=1 Tax=Stichopus japonicus TaxID=307972 RepID=A0A2G8JHX9_STIJA|nr:putative calcium-binding mitochondrial carrier protein Aralar1 isoform X2 [Apostichopus japonicus]
MASNMIGLKRASCESGAPVSRALHLIKRADAGELRKIFQKNASVEKKGEQFMTSEDFIRGYLGMQAERNYNADTMKLLAGVVDQTKDGLISFIEFQAFEALLCSPDALHMVAFQLFDTNGSGFISFDEFKGVYSATEVHKEIPFNFDCRFVRLHFGKTRRKNYLMRSLHNFYRWYTNVSRNYLPQSFIQLCDPFVLRYYASKQNMKKITEIITQFKEKRRRMPP